LNPLCFSSLPKEAAVIPLPSPDTTPPVTKMYFIRSLLLSLKTIKRALKSMALCAVFFKALLDEKIIQLHRKTCKKNLAFFL
jgi:hypothetical protein